MTEEDKQLLVDYLQEMKQRGSTTQGLIGLRHRVHRLLNWLEENDLLPCEVRASEALAYQGWLQQRKTGDGKPLSKNSIVAYVTAASSFFESLKRRRIIAANPFKEIRRVRGKRILPRHILREKEMNRLLEELGRFQPEQNLKYESTRYKIHVVAELMYATGLRISEVANLKVEDIDFKKGLVHVRQGKGGKSRVALLNDYAREVLRLYVEKMRSVLFSEWHERNADLLFGVKWNTFGKLVNSTLQKAAAAAGVGNCTAHGFRHALGFHLLRAGCNIRHIQSILGHSNLKNTEVYTKVDKKDLREVLDKYHPRRWREKTDDKTDSKES